MNRSMTNVLFGALARPLPQRVVSKRDRCAKSVSTTSPLNSLTPTKSCSCLVTDSQPRRRNTRARTRRRAREARCHRQIRNSSGRRPHARTHERAARRSKRSYSALYELEQINPEFPTTDVAVVIGANDVVNPDARDNPTSPIAGMPILEVDRSKSVVVLKRGQGKGFSGLENPLFLSR